MPRLHRDTALLIGGGLIVAVLATAPAKEGPTYFTPERVAIARSNVEKYDWARKLKEKILKRGDPYGYYTGKDKYTAADTFAAQSDEFMWLLQPPTAIPRIYRPANKRNGCPIHGKAIQAYNVWNPWRIDPIGHPYKVQCPIGKEWLPTNDYHKGDMTSGEYPDDGNGVLHKGKRYYLLQEYAHMVYGSIVTPTLRSLAEAYQLTGDPKYAHKGCILLARLATQYPNFGWDADPARGLPAEPQLEDRSDRTYRGPWGNRDPFYGAHGGLITDHIWETFNLEAIALAYDGLYDYIDKDPDLIAFLKSKGMPVENGRDLREYIETYILRAGARALIQGEVRGNEGMHQATALTIALVLDDYGSRRPNSQDLVDYAYHGVGHAAYLLTNGLTRDGGGHESPSYNGLKLGFVRVARLMEEIRRRHPGRFPVERYPDLFGGPKARRLFDYFIDIVLNDCDYPSIGDTGGIRLGPVHRAKRPSYSFRTHEYIYAVSRFKDPRYARACVDAEGDLYTGELWEPYPEEEIRELLRRPEANAERASRLLDGYGVAILESGSWPERRTAAVNYSSLIGHWQADQLTLYLYARGVDMLPDIGYPKTWQYRWNWDGNSLAHNTVTVNETQFARNLGGMARLFASVGGVHVVTVSHDPYPDAGALGRPDAPPVDLFERTVIMVDVDDDRFYVVDLFAVNGGDQHDQSWHAMAVSPEAPELDWRVQETGTLAGPDVPQFGEWTDRWGRERRDFPSYLLDIRRASLERPARWTWKSGLPEGDTLHLHVIPVGGPAEVIMGRGRSPAWPEDKLLGYLLVRRHVAGGGVSHFLGVLDAFQAEPVVRGVRLLSEKPIALAVERADGTDEVTVHLPDGTSRSTENRPVGVRVLIRQGAEVVRDIRIGQWKPDLGSGYVTAPIEGVDYGRREVLVPYDGTLEQVLAPGRAVRIYNEDRSALYRVEKVDRSGAHLRVTLDQTALFARGPVKDVADDCVIFDAHFIFARRGGWERLGLSGRCAFDGARIGEGRAARLVGGATRGGKVFLKSSTPAAVLRKDYLGKVVSIWQYGVGDRLEAARVEVARAPEAPGDREARGE